jgi:FAD/FMN-containing dehydrogenase
MPDVELSAVPIGVVLGARLKTSGNHARVLGSAAVAAGARRAPRRTGRPSTWRCHHRSKHLDRVPRSAAAACASSRASCAAFEAPRRSLTFAPDPATHSRCTLGGMIGNNSCGPHSVMAGKTVENIEALEVDLRRAVWWTY